MIIHYIPWHKPDNNIAAQALCEKPTISYTIGSFDGRFGISREDFIKYAEEAEQIWEGPMGDQLLVYSTDGDLKMNLVYDWRQEAITHDSKKGPGPDLELPPLLQLPQPPPPPFETQESKDNKTIVVGNYENGADGKNINVYRFKDAAELTRILAHEFGHALGLNHTDNPKSIMYWLIDGNDKILTADDFLKLDRLCGR